MGMESMAGSARERTESSQPMYLAEYARETEEEGTRGPRHQRDEVSRNATEWERREAKGKDREGETQGAAEGGEAHRAKQETEGCITEGDLYT